MLVLKQKLSYKIVWCADIRFDFKVSTESVGNAASNKARVASGEGLSYPNNLF